MTRTWYKNNGLIEKILTGLLTGLVNGSNHTKCVLLNNQKSMTQLTLINFHLNEYRKEFGVELGLN